MDESTQSLPPFMEGGSSRSVKVPTAEGSFQSIERINSVTGVREKRGHTGNNTGQLSQLSTPQVGRIPHLSKGSTEACLN
jgi:hypothetical protein